MAISDAQYTAWLSNSNAVRCVLVEAVARIVSTETTLYLSSKGYRDEVGGQNYQAVVLGNSVRVTERMGGFGRSSLSFGDIEIDNTDGSRDGWLDYIWSNRSITVLLGDATWDRSDFRTIFSGVTSDIDSRSKDVLNIKLSDKMERLNVAITDAKLGGATINKNELKPLCFGECHNVSPLLTNPATLEYQVHDGPIEDIKEVRNDGVVVSVSKTLSTGKFTLNTNPQGGKITASVQGDKPSTWDNTVRDIIERLVTDYGETNNQFVAGDLDSTNLDAFDAANTQAIGVYYPRRANLRQACDDIAATLGAQMVMSRLGKLQLHKIDLPPPGTPLEVNEQDIFANTFEISERIPVEAAIKLFYAKNWTVQEALETRVVQESKDLFEKEWLSVVSEDATTKTNYRLNAEPEGKETFLLTETHADAEADRLLTLFKTQRHIMRFRGRPRLSELQLGDAITITHSRFGFSGGKTGMVIGIAIDYSNLFVDVEVFV